MPHKTDRRWRSGGRVAPEGKLTLTQASLILGRSRERVRQLANAGAFGDVERPKANFVYLDAAAVDAYLQKRTEMERLGTEIFGPRSSHHSAA